MATFLDDQEELWLPCPFDPIHIISKRRYNIHVQRKCPQRHREDMKQCPYNAVHYVPVACFEKHIRECDDRHQFEREAYDEYLFKQNNDGKCFIYGDDSKKEKKVDDECKEQFDEYKIEEKEEMKFVVAGLQGKIVAEELAEKFEKCDLMPSSYAYDNLPRASRKKFLQLVLQMKKSKDVEDCDSSSCGAEKKTNDYFFESWNFNDMSKEEKVQITNKQNDMNAALNIRDVNNDEYEEKKINNNLAFNIF